jgi:hypothetical protein
MVIFHVEEVRSNLVVAGDNAQNSLARSAPIISVTLTEGQSGSQK